MSPTQLSRFLQRAAVVGLAVVAASVPSMASASPAAPSTVTPIAAVSAAAVYPLSGTVYPLSGTVYPLSGTVGPVTYFLAPLGGTIIVAGIGSCDYLLVDNFVAPAHAECFVSGHAFAVVFPTADHPGQIIIE